MSAWVSLIATALGALIAISGTTLADYLKHRRDERKSLRQDKQQLSTDFILAANRATGMLRRAATRDAGGAATEAAARSAVGDSGIYDARERVLLAAPPNLAAGAEKAFQAVRQLRDAVLAGNTADSAPCRAAYHRITDAIWQMRQAARANIGAEPLDLDAMADASRQPQDDSAG